MKREEKNQLSKDKILRAAIEEFGTKGFENASLNNICTKHNLSKGLIYHYFENKDKLYLCCVKSCFDALAAFHENKQYVFTNFQKDINCYLTARFHFFQMYPHYSHLFFTSILQPPQQLKEQIKELQKELYAQNIRYYSDALEHITLRSHITKEDALEYFIIFQEMFNGYFQSRAREGSNFNTLIEDHELKLSALLNLMIYGIAKEEKDQ